MTLASYRTLGRCGLVVSPLALATMTFGTARWGMDEAGSTGVSTLTLRQKATLWTWRMCMPEAAAKT
jgi:aryl-alcohol dehydrogenase-like predicted oxidoreductase